MAHHDTSDINLQPANGTVSWFAGGALVVAFAIGLFLYADGYFANEQDAVPSLTIEGN